MTGWVLENRAMGLGGSSRDNIDRKFGNYFYFCLQMFCANMPGSISGEKVWKFSLIRCDFEQTVNMSYYQISYLALCCCVLWWDCYREVNTSGISGMRAWWCWYKTKIKLTLIAVKITQQTKTRRKIHHLRDVVGEHGGDGLSPFRSRVSEMVRCSEMMPSVKSLVSPELVTTNGHLSLVYQLV